MENSEVQSYMPPVAQAVPAATSDNGWMRRIGGVLLLLGVLASVVVFFASSAFADSSRTVYQQQAAFLQALRDLAVVFLVLELPGAVMLRSKD